jgi:uracil-DNA glycosylase
MNNQVRIDVIEGEGAVNVVPDLTAFDFNRDFLESLEEEDLLNSTATELEETNNKILALENSRVRFQNLTISIRDYLSPLSGAVLNNDWNVCGISNILFIFLGPPSEIAVNREVGWNPFLKLDGSYVRTIQLLSDLMNSHENLPNNQINKVVKIDCLSHRGWPLKTKITLRDLKIAKELVKETITILKPSIVVCFGKEPSVIVRSIGNDTEIKNKDLTNFKFSLANLSSNLMLEDNHIVRCLAVTHPGYYNRKLALTKPLFNECFNILSSYITFDESEDEY